MNDFDFFVGSWDVRNRRLAERLVGSDDWEEFPGFSTGIRVFEGGANVDEIIFPSLGSRGLTLRLYDPSRDEWSLYWSSSRDGLLQPPVVGRFRDGVGEFHGDDTDGGRPIRVRYRWSGITATTARWEQAFSADGEQTWETNWIMDFTRREQPHEFGPH
jgi:hypothetical protein